MVHVYRFFVLVDTNTWYIPLTERDNSKQLAEPCSCYPASSSIRSESRISSVYIQSHFSKAEGQFTPNCPIETCLCNLKAISHQFYDMEKGDEKKNCIFSLNAKVQTGLYGFTRPLVGRKLAGGEMCYRKKILH